MSKTVVDAVTEKERPLKIAIDFDGVLHSYASGWTGQIPFDPPVDGAQNFCEQLLMEGYHVVIFTARVHPELGVGNIQRFISYSEKTRDGWNPLPDRGPVLAEEGIRDWLQHWNFPEGMLQCEITHKKEHADLFIDDRAYRFDGSFVAALEYIEKINPALTSWVGSM